jgi:hypothetical protein
MRRPTPRAAAALRRLAGLAIVLGLGLIAAAVVWWAIFFHPVGLADAASCLYSRGGACLFVRRVAAAAGRVAYSPSVFWLGAASLVGGLVLRAGAAALK